MVRFYLSLLMLIFYQYRSYGQGKNLEFSELRKFGSIIEGVDTLQSTPLTYFKNSIPIIHIWIEGKKYTFIFDTGAMISLISDNLTPNKNAIGYTTLSDFSDNEEKVEVLLQSFSIGYTKFIDFPFLVKNFSSIENQFCTKIDGIIGMNVIGQFNWIFNPINHKITFSKVPFKPDFDFTKMNITLYSEILPLVELKYDNISFYSLLDSGFDGYLEINPQVLNSSKKYKKTKTNKGYGMYQATINSTLTNKIETITLDTIWLNREKYLTDNQTTITFSKPTLGSKFLVSNITYLNFINKELFFKPIENKIIDSAQSFPVNFNLKNHNLYISFLWDEPYLKKMKLEIGDIVMSIDEFPTTNLSTEKWCEINSTIQKRHEIIITLSKGDSKNKQLTLSKIKIFPSNNY